jgi:hypothetical protein
VLQANKQQNIASPIFALMRTTVSKCALSIRPEFSASATTRHVIAETMIALMDSPPRFQKTILTENAEIVSGRGQQRGGSSGVGDRRRHGRAEE